MQFDRAVNLKIQVADPPPSITYNGNMEISNLRMAFSIYKSESWSTNTANVKIWNLGQDKRNKLNNYGNEIKVFAGYKCETGPELIFIGNSRFTTHLFAEPEIITTFDCGDGEKTLNAIVVSWSFGENIPVRTVIQAYADLLGLNIVEISSTDNLVYSLGHKHSGIAKDGLDKACKALGLFASVQNNNLVILKPGVGSSKEPALIDADSGMIGIPQRYTDRKQYNYRAIAPNSAPKNGWKIRCLLRPDILPGDRVRIKSERADIDGIFYVISIRHDGDTHGPQFESLLEVVAV